MIYGRRVIESHQWLYKTGSLRRFRVVDRSFQWKYTLYILAAVVGSALIFMGPALFFLHQNYEIFSSLAYQTDPGLVEHLERETIWLNLYFGLGVVLLAVLCTSIGLKLTDTLAGPLLSMENHMRRLAQGDWSQSDFRLRVTDDYRTLGDTYAYLYKSLQAQTHQDLRWLEKIVIDPQNREAVAAWEALVRTKQSQLGIAKLGATAVNETDAKTFEVPSKRRAS
jgi:hypothetical protein